MVTEYEREQQLAERALAYFDHLREQGFPGSTAAAHCSQRFGLSTVTMQRLANSRNRSGETLWGVGSHPDKLTPV